MKKITMVIILLLATAVWVGAQTCESGNCSCASCTARAEGKYTLPGLEGLEHADHDHATEGQTGKSAPHVEQAFQPAQVGQASEGQTGKSAPQAQDEHVDCEHDHGTEVVEVDPHAGHDHADEEAGGAVELSDEIIKKIGLQICEAVGGTIAKAAVFPAEIKLDRDRSAAVSPRYASVVRQVFAEIGDTVKKGDVLASLENRETMAVYTVSAPLDGIIISKDLAVGESAGEERVLFEVADLSFVWADISIFPKYQHLVRKGMPVEFIAHDGHAARGTVKYISPIVSHETRTFNARCVLEGAGEDFTPGAFVRARIVIEKADVTVNVEREAVQTLEGETVIFVPGDHGFQTRVVELGLADQHTVEIRHGLEPGEPYVAVGAFALKAEILTSGMDPHAGHGH